MDMQSPGDRVDPTLGELFEQLIAEGRTFVQAEARIAEVKFTRRVRMVALPVGLLGASAVLALIALMAAAAAIVILLGPLVGFMWAAVIVAALTGALSFALYSLGRARLQTALRRTPGDSL